MHTNCTAKLARDTKSSKSSSSGGSGGSGGSGCPVRHPWNKSKVFSMQWHSLARSEVKLEGGPEVGRGPPPRNLADQGKPYSNQGADYAPHTTASPPDSKSYLHLWIWSINNVLIISDESEPSWLEPELELKDFQLSLAPDLFLFSSKLKIGLKWVKILILIFFYLCS